MANIIQGDLLSCNDPIICQQLNCLCVKPHGLSDVITKRYPYADVYGRRRQEGRRNLCIKEDEGIPGDIAVSRCNTTNSKTQPSPTNSNDIKPIVVGLYGQYDYGKAGPYRTRRPHVKDNYLLRERWFKESLVKLGDFMKTEKITTVAFPYGIGCGLAGGNWKIYLEMLNEFALSTGFTTNIYFFKTTSSEKV